MRWSESQLADYELRQRAKKPDHLVLESKAVERESDLHDQIISFCKTQHPRWMFIHARMDQRSTIPVGAADFVIFMPGGKILILECKRKGGKCSPEQMGWALQLELLGHTAHVVRSMEQFHKLIQ